MWALSLPSRIPQQRQLLRREGMRYGRSCAGACEKGLMKLVKIDVAVVDVVMYMTVRHAL